MTIDQRNEIRRLRRRVRLLTAALTYARSKFHGTAAALGLVREGHGRLNLDGAHDSMQAGNIFCSEILQSGEYMDPKTVDRVLGARLKRAKGEILSIDYSTISIDRRRTATLMRMWRDLNLGKWPEEFGPRQELDLPHTVELMNHIALKVGKRTILADPRSRSAPWRLRPKGLARR